MIRNWLTGGVNAFDKISAILGLSMLLAFLVSLPFAPRLTLYEFFLQRDKGGQVMVKAAGQSSAEFVGGYTSTVHNAVTGYTLENCKGGSETHAYPQGLIYGEPKSLSWWLFPSDTPSVPCVIPDGTAVYVLTTYTLPGYMWGMLPPRTVTYQSSTLEPRR